MRCTGVIRKDLLGEPYHVILADGTSSGFLGVSLRDELNVKSHKRASSIGLVGDNAILEGKNRGIDSALCTLLLLWPQRKR
mmetsp:Transcript_43049/g.43673  ORF Transcript_43049/g.43673 Transcript_43049/m.43673 type:complete len:81 (-) Transcript_43049:234-476(-)